MLLDRSGRIKLCDFGVSKKLINSVASTHIGSQKYMAPERFQCTAYDVRSDVWSLGMSMMEMALGRSPYLNWETSRSFERTLLIVEGPAPALSQADHDVHLCDFVNSCLQKSLPDRATLANLRTKQLVTLYGAVDISEWANDVSAQLQNRIALSRNNSIDSSLSLSSSSSLLACQ